MMTCEQNQTTTISWSLLAAFTLIILHIQCATCESRGGGQANRIGKEIFTNVAKSPGDPIQCEVFIDLNKNLMTPIDVVVRNSESKVACIKARFALSIKLEESSPAMQFDPESDPTKLQPADNTGTGRSILGYLPLEQVLSVEDSCPEKNAKKADEGTAKEGDEKKGENNGNVPADGTGEPDDAETNDDEQEMIVTFGCGKLVFTFKRDKTRIFVSSIKGVVKLDKESVREFISFKPVFLTSDLDHHFKYDDIIEVTSEAESKGFILTANFHFTEIEAFRETTSRDFIRPPDESSKPYSDEQTSLEPIKAPRPVTNGTSLSTNVNT